MNDYAERIAQAAAVLQAIYNDVAREISETKRRIDALEMRDELSLKKSRELERMRFELDELEEALTKLDQA